MSTVSIRALVVFALATAALVGCGQKKKAVTHDEFKAVSDHIFKNMNGNAHSLDERKSYTLSQLGAPHRTEADALYWYTSPVSCNYYKLSTKEGYASWGTGLTDECKQWAPQ